VHLSFGVATSDGRKDALSRRRYYAPNKLIASVSYEHIVAVKRAMSTFGRRVFRRGTREICAE